MEPAAEDEFVGAERKEALADLIVSLIGRGVNERGALKEHSDSTMLGTNLLQEESFREFDITLIRNNENQAILTKMESNFQFAGGSFNVLDLQYHAAQYLARDGQLKIILAHSIP